MVSNVAYLFKIAVSISLYAYLVGSAESGGMNARPLENLQKGFSSGVLLYAPMILQLILYIIITISIKIGLLSKCPDIFSLNTYA